MTNDIKPSYEELLAENEKYRLALEKIRNSENRDDFHYLATRCAMEALRCD